MSNESGYIKKRPLNRGLNGTLILKRIERRRDLTSTVNEGLWRLTSDRQYRSVAKKPAEIELFPFFSSDCRDDYHSGRLGVDHANGRLIGDKGGNHFWSGISWDDDHIQTD